MKKNQKYQGLRVSSRLSLLASHLLVLTSLLLTSCDSWIDVTPTDRLSEEMVFDSRAGYVEALNGIYLELVNSSLYGENLTTGMLDVMGQYYTNYGSSTHKYYYFLALDYSHADEKSRLETIWRKSYNLIANCNALIEKCDNSGDKLREPYKSMIKGEALALRAMLHFDMLRLFGPVPSNLSQTAIPYQTGSRLEVPPMMTGTQIIDKVKEDLNSALTLLRTSDPYLATDQTVYDNVDVENRQFRLNYFAVKALLARVYLWGGDKDNAYKTAVEVINEGQNGAKALFPFTTSSAATNASNPDRLFSSEVLFAAYNSLREEDVYNKLFIPTLESTYLFTFAGNLTSGRINDLYDDKNDYRYGIWATYNNNGTEVVYHRKFANISSSSKINYMMPLIRMSEMYLIAAECASSNSDAALYFNNLRHARNCFSIQLTDENLQTSIAAEYKKEMLGEGQLFYYYKRNELAGIPDGAQAQGNKTITTDNYVIPLPDGETSQREGSNS